MTFEYMVKAEHFRMLIKQRLCEEALPSFFPALQVFNAESKH